MILHSLMTFRRCGARCALVTLLAGAACTPPQEPDVPPAAPVVTVSMTEYSFSFDRTIPAGRVIIRSVNEGKVLHLTLLSPLGDDFPPIDEQLRGEERRTLIPMASTPPRRPGETGIFAVDLRPGRYAFLCTLLDSQDDTSHALKGMASEFRVE